MNKLVKKIGVVSAGLGGSLVTATTAFASTPNVTESMTTAMNAVKTDTLSAIGAVAPIGIGIMGAFLVWRYGIKFFKSISK